MCASTKRHFITCIVIVSIFFFFSLMKGRRGEDGSLMAPISKGGVEVKTNQNESMKNTENLERIFF